MNGGHGARDPAPNPAINKWSPPNPFRDPPPAHSGPMPHGVNLRFSDSSKLFVADAHGGDEMPAAAPFSTPLYPISMRTRHHENEKPAPSVVWADGGDAWSQRSSSAAHQPRHQWCVCVCVCVIKRESALARWCVWWAVCVRCVLSAD